VCLPSRRSQSPNILSPKASASDEVLCGAGRDLESPCLAVACVGAIPTPGSLVHFFLGRGSCLAATTPLPSSHLRLPCPAPLPCPS